MTPRSPDELFMGLDAGVGPEEGIGIRMAQVTTLPIQLYFVSLALMLIISLGGVSLAAAAEAPCEPWVAKLVSAQGTVQVRRAGESQWQPVKLDETYCAADMLRVQGHSRAAVVLRNEINLRLDQNSTITFLGLEAERTSLLDLLIGAAYFFSRIPRSLQVTTPFVNAAVEGTEFFVKVEREQTLLSIFEGLVTATNQAGSLALASGQSAIARVGEAPLARVVVRPRDAVQWALYYPPILDYRPADFANGAERTWQAMVRRSIQFYREGNLAMAFASITGAPEEVSDPRFFTYRAGLLLSVGRVDEARQDSDRALMLDPRHSPAFAVRSVIALAQNDKAESLRLARTAVELDSTSAAARVALSYAQQADFDLKSALASLQEAVKLAPENALAWARLAELWLSFGELKKALKAANQSVKLQPTLARTQTMLGFAYLTQIKTKDAKKALEQAIQLDQADPLPRLGLGLAKIRESGLESGREEIEIAVSLDPNNSLTRSYLGKAYYEEKRDPLARDQFAIAKELDPKDPTPWFYDAIRKQSVNRPVEALQDLQKSIELNDNRAVYRSRLLLDQDLAARSASLGRIYNDLGFQQLALVEGWKSLNADPSNYSAHRFLADSYAVLPRHEIARVSELLQSQLLQPINITPVQPRLAESNLLILQGAGPTELSFNEFNPLFNRNRFALLASGVAGSNSTFGDELVQSGIWGRFSYSLGQFHFETDGTRPNNDFREDIYNAFSQVSLSHKTSVQAEYRYSTTTTGDLRRFFDPDFFFPSLRQKGQNESVRLGFHHGFTPNSDVIASFIYQNLDFDAVLIPGFAEFSGDEDAYIAESQHLFRSELLNIISGLGYFRADGRQASITFPLQPMVTMPSSHHTNAYSYFQLNFLRNLSLTIGGSADFFSDTNVERNQFNPKFGLTWNALPGTTLRGGVFRVLKRRLVSNQTLEPTQVAGFNQFFDDLNGADAWRYGVAIDQKFSAHVYGGAEFSEREATMPVVRTTPVRQVLEFDRDERLARSYIYWTPLPWIALKAEYQYERLTFDPPNLNELAVAEIQTHRLPFGFSFFHPSGLIAWLQTTYVDQEGEFEDRLGNFSSGSDRFWVVDASIGFRLPRRFGLVNIGVKNLFDQRFKFQDTDPVNPTISPERLILGRVTLAF
ncbi:MAG TPA: TonB-dependent receptor [Candidatus Tectomicrobia bacterium]|nr:TonB-dependent receptor [Candidatus Tectomicrobia bacterium]